MRKKTSRISRGFFIKFKQIIKMEKNNTKITSKGNPLTLLGPEVKVNDKAVDFTVANHSFGEVKLNLRQVVYK